MDALDIESRLRKEAVACSQTLEVCYHISTLDVGDPEICYGIFEPVPKQYSRGVIRRFETLEEASSHYQSLKENNPSPSYVIKPDGHLPRHSDEGGACKVKYSCVFEKLQHWLDNFVKKNRSDVDLFKFLDNLGPALEYRYKETGSIGDIVNDTVITDYGRVLFWNWAPKSKDFKTEVGILRNFIVDIKKLAKNPSRLQAFEDFINDVILVFPDPATDLQLWVFNNPVFMTKKKSVRFLEALHKMVCDPSYPMSTNVEFNDAIRKYDTTWKNNLSTYLVLQKILTFRGGYKVDSFELPRYVYNSVKHYGQHAQNLNQPELTQVEVIDLFYSIQDFEALPEDLFRALYEGVNSLEQNLQTPSNYSLEKVLDMVKGGESM